MKIVTHIRDSEFGDLVDRVADELGATVTRWSDTSTRYPIEARKASAPASASAREATTE